MSVDDEGTVKDHIRDRDERLGSELMKKFGYAPPVVEVEKTETPEEEE